MKKKERVVNSIFPNFNHTSNDLSNPGTIFYHYHKFEIVDTRPPKTYEERPLTRAETIKNIVADALIILGSVMAILAGTALTLQTVGISSPVLPLLANLLMPSVAAILTGFNLSKNEIRAPGTQLRLPTGLPGLTFSA